MVKTSKKFNLRDLEIIKGLVDNMVWIDEKERESILTKVAHKKMKILLK